MPRITGGVSKNKYYNFFIYRNKHAKPQQVYFKRFFKQLYCATLEV